MKYVFVYHLENAQWYLIPEEMRAEYTRLLDAVSKADTHATYTEAVEAFDGVFDVYLSEHPSLYVVENPVMKF